MASETAAAGQFVMVPVRVEMVDAVYQFLASRAQGAARSEAASKPEKPRIERDALRRGEWTAQAIRRNWNDSSDAMKAILRYLADAGDQPIQKEELASSLCGNADAASLRTLRSTLAAFGNRTKHRYGFETWPFSAEGGYFMPSEIAELHRGL